MSLYRFIASNNPLVEVDKSGFIKMKVKDIRKTDPTPIPPASFNSWDEMDDDATILFAKDESELGGLNISICDVPPYGLDNYISKKYIYWLDGDFGSDFLEQLTDYLLTNIKEKDNVELWSIWFGDGIKPKQVKTIPLSEIATDNLEILRNHECCCIQVI